MMAVVILGMLAGAYIGFGGLLSSAVTFDMVPVSGIGLKKLISGATFSVGLMLVIVAGAELFTGNNLIILSVMSGKTSLKDLSKNWLVVYLSNFAGSILVAMLFYFSGLWKTGDNGLGVAAIKIAHAKVNLTFTEAFVRSIGCNWMVCLAVWMAWGSRNIGSKILAIFFPIMGFVAIGFEHCVANMYFIPSALFLKEWGNISVAGVDLNSLSWSAFFFKNLLPVTIGNIIGGSIFVGMSYWYAYVKPNPNPNAK
jgi:formate/nitrite transporter